MNTLFTKIFGVFLLLISIAFTYFGVVTFNSFRTDLANSTQTTAKVLNVNSYTKTEYRPSSKVSYKINFTICEYKVNFYDLKGNSITTIISDQKSSVTECGINTNSEIKIYYNATKPVNAELPRHHLPFNGAYIFFTIGILFLFFTYRILFT